MSVDNKKYKIALPDGRTTVWTQEQFDKQGEALLSKYPDANIVTSEDYDPSASYEAGVAYGIQTPDGRSTYWDADQFGKQGEALMSKYPDAKITVYNDASKSYWRQKAEEQKESITRFDQDNHEFMFKHEMDKILYDSGEGNITEDAYLADDAKYNELATLKKKLQADYSNNPYVQAIYKTEAQYSDGKAAEYDSIRENMRGDNPFLGASRQMQSGTEAENDEYMLYGQAKDLARNTAKTFAVETAKAPGENGFVDYLRNYGKAYADVFSDPDFWSRGITEISRNLNLRDIMQKLESKGIDLNEVTEKQLDENLTGGEKALLSEFVRNVYAKATRAADMAPGYTTGQVSAESIGFMAEFLATGAIGRALGAGIGAAEEASSAGLRSWIARELRKGSADAIESSVKRSLVNSLTKGGKVALTQGMKNVVSGASRAASGAYSGIVRPVEQAIWHTALQPSTYRQISENLTRIDNNGELISAGNAIWGGVLDQMVENWSETMGGAVETVLGIPFKAAGWAGEKVLGRTTLGQWGKWLADSQAARVLHDAGFNGLIGEMGEEWLGNAARVGLGIMDKDEFKNFASWNEQLEMAASFAPMSLFGLGSSTYAAARQAKEYKQAAEAMRGVLNRAGMTEDEISDIMDTKHTKKEIADALTPVIQRIVHGRQDNTTATEDYITTLKFAQASAMNEVVATAQSIEKEKERKMVRRGIGEELGATSEGDERGRFTHIMKTDRLDADGNPYELEAVTTVKDADGAEWFYMGDNGSQVVLKKRGENGGKPMFLSQEQYAQRVESGEYTETTQLATQFLDEEAEKIRTAEEQARTNQEVQDRYAALLNVFSQNPDINLGTEDAPMNGRVTDIVRDGIIVDFGQPVLLNGVTRQIHKISLEQAGNAVGIDTAMRGDEQRERDSIDQEYLNRQKVSAYNKTYAGKEFTLDGEPYRFVRMFEAPYLDESGTEQVKVTATDARGEDVEIVLPLEELQSQALTPQEQTLSDADQDEAGARVITETTGSLKDFRGNDIPMRINEKTGEEEVDKREFKKRDPEAYYRWNDSRRGGNTSDSMEAIQADITAKTAEKDSLAAQRQGETDPDMRDELEGQINRLNNEINLLAGIYHKYDAAGNFQNAQRQYAEKFADVERRMLNAKTQEQYDELVTIQRELTKDYFTEMQDAAYTMTLNQRTVELQSALNEIADVPVQVVTMAQIEEVMRSDNASEDAIAKVLDKIADIQRRNMVEGKSYALDGLHYNGKVYIFAEGNRNIDDARVTYYHERQHDINKRNPAAVDAVLVLADNNHDALFQTLTAIIGDAGTYRKSDERTLADEIVAFTMEKAWTNPEYVDELRALGLSDELINIISSEYGRQQGTSEDLDSGSGDRTARNSDSGQADYRIDEQARGGESGDEQLGSAQPGVEAEEPIGSITPETAAELADKGLVMDGGVVMSADLSALKQAVGYLTPNEKSPEQEIVEYSVRTRKAWADNYRKYPDSEERVIRALENLAERMAADELVSGVISQGDYKYGKKDKGSFAGPLRTNIEYIVTFDMDTTCPRTFQYLNYVKQIENRIGRPLTQTECIQLTEMMRMYGQQIPCVYCYSENKRQALKQYYTDFMTARHAVLNAATDEEALEHMYGHGTSKAARESKDPAVALNEAAYKVFLQWRSERKTAYNPSLKMLWFQYSNDRNVVLNVLDQLYADGRIMTDLNDDVIAAVVDTELRINDPAAVKVVEDIVSEWKWDAIEGREHSDFTPVEEDDLVVDPRTLSLWREMTSYAKSASQAKSVLRYIPYTDELKKLSQEQKDYINGMGGVRMHSSNDFRIDYVFDYFQFMADMAANKMFGHTYTKSPEFVRIFGNSGYKINMSIAAYEDEKGNIRMNEDEGFNWDVAKELRDAFPNAGVMLMATSDNQIQMALDSDWIDMFIPFHASSLPKAVWYNMRAWKDYTTVQNEAFLNGDEMRAALISDGVELPKSIKAADVERMYLEHFNIKTIIGTAGKQKGKRLRPHFLPGPTVVDGQYVPGHDNDTGKYLQLCREYGVHPRFYGIKVKNAEGKTIDITEHPNYIKCIKETARTDSPQTAVRFNFDQPSEALGGKTPIEYAFDELQARAAAEMQAAGSPVRDIYKSLEKDAFGIVPQFIDTIIKHKEKTGKDYPIDYITPDSRKWFLTERKALEEAYKDIETIPYHRNEYDIEGEPVKTRVTEKSDDAQKIEQQKALDFINGTRSFAEEGGDIRYSIRTKPAPKSTGIGYKVFYLKDGKLYPPMVANPGGADTPVGVWLDADAAPQAAASKTGRKKVKAGGKGTQGGSGTLAYRPGWHLGEIPYALQFNRGPKVDNPLGITGKNGKAIKVGKYFPANFVWAEVEYAKDVDYQDEAMSYGYNGAGNFQHSLAGLPKIPVDGAYTYRTNANPATDPWIITGAMKVNRVLTDSEVDELVRQAGREPQLREGKTEETRDVRENNEPNFRVVNDNQQVFISNALASLDKIPMKSGNAQAWINKIQQAGGLKKEEDKWMGLTDWLKEQKGNISKEDVAEFIREHQVQIEEVKYGTTPINTDYSGAIAGEKGVEFRDRFLDAFNVYLEEGDEDMGIPDRFRSELVNDEEAMDLYNENHEDKVSLDEEGYLDNVAQDKVMTWGDEILDAVTGTGEKPVNSTRMSYTTDGLENNREIALVVPTIEPYKESDDVHFGDAGEGRAVAWSRFGDAVDKDGNKVLVIDEIQSKRHQDAKENGYSEKDIPSKMDAYSAKEKAFEDYDRVFAELSGKYSEEDVREMLMSEEDNASYKDVLEKRKEANRIYNLAISRVPDAPFRDSWDALAMKRMLRFAAEEGYDKIAWTNGQMQSDRYDLTKVLDDFYYKPNGDGTYKVSAALNQRRTGYTEYSDLNYDSLTVDRIGEIFGKEIAAKVSEGKGRKGYSHNDERDWITFSGRDLKMANEGMRYFYDQKLVNWMNKYGKKWGVQVADLTLPGLENKEGWHSVDVTAEMKESVMEGQPMFRATEVAGNPSLIAVHNLTENDLLDAFDLGGFPMPSIAITKADIGHTDFGDISLVFGKETINPKNRKNKVYSGDAWTPTFPTINYKLNEDKASDIATRARKVGDLPLFNPSHFNSVNYEGRIEDFGARSLIEEFKNDYNAKQFYLAEQGNPVREYEMHEVEKYTEENVRRIKELLDKIGLENLKGVDRNLTPEILQVVKGFLNAVGDIDDSRIKRIARNYVVHAIDYATNGNRTTEIDYDATHRKIDERIDQSAFEKWLEDLFTGIVEKRGIRNEVDMFTPIGNRRAWEKLYDEVTLDNVVKAMSKKPERGGSGFFGGNIFGASFKTYNSIADIREDAARRMAVVDSEELQKQKDDILNRLSNVKVTEKELGVGEMFDLTTNIKDAVAKSHTAEGIHGYLKDYYPDITMDAAQEIADIVKDIQSISTKYFEAKPYRAVGFDEVKLAVVPEDASQAIVDGLQERGVPVRTYEKDNQQERMDIISNATEEMGLRFRTVEITPETRDEMEQIKALARLNGTYLKAPNGADTKLTPEQWAMVRTKAFKAWFGDWENDPAGASKVVDENGEPMVMYHGTGREFYTFGNTDSANELGAGFYFTDNRRLAEAYTNPRLSDNESKIEARAMEIFIDDMGHSEEDSYDNEFVHDYNEAYDMAETELFGKPRVMSGFLNVRNPRMVVDNSNLEEEQGEHDGVIDNTFGKRHGGLMIQSRAGESAMQVMVYNPNQIKSATDNNGSLDPTDPDIRYRATPAQDAEYMSAVEAGDMEKAERMVRDAAKAAGYNLEAYHGTDVDFNEFKRVHHANGNIWGSGFYFADSEDAAAGWGERASIVNFNDDYKVLHTYLSVHNPFELYADRLELGLGEHAEDVISKLDPEYDADIIEAIRTGTRIEDFRGWANDRIAEAIQELGFDAIQGYYYDEYHTMVFSPNQVKSADPVTYDDEGNIIPLSRRFNPESDDIRFRISARSSEGENLSEGQQAYFANSKAVDEKGNLLTLYHGTPRAGFNEFRSGFFTTSKKDADSYGGNDREGKLYDPNEQASSEKVIAGDFRLGYMTFDSEEDRADFLAKHPLAEDAMTLSQLDEAIDNANYDGDVELEKELESKRDAYKEIENDYRDYEFDHLVTTTWNDLLANPSAYTENDFRRAFLAYDSNAVFDDIDDMDPEDRIDAYIDALNYAVEETAAEGGDALSIEFSSRVPRNGEGTRVKDMRHRTYKVYINVENPFEMDAKGRHSEFESGYVYESIKNAMADPQYDGVIVRNWRVGRYQELGDVVVPKDKNQIKLTTNINPTESDDIRFRISGENATFAEEDANELANDIANEVYRQISSQENSGNLATEVDSESDGEVLFRFIGELGADRLDKTDGGRRILNLIEAKKYYTPESAENIKRSYGWELDKDAKGNPVWKYEENDFGINDLDIKDGAKLSDVIDDEDLFAAYPELKNYTLAIEDLKDASGYFNETNKKIALKKGVEKEDDRLTLIHEIQHFIQRKEGWVRGTNDKSPLILDTVKDIFPYIRKDLNMFLKSAAKRIFNKSYKKESISNFRFFKDKWGFSPIEYLFYLKKTNYLAYEAYLRKAGEVEARNAEKRADMTALERRRSLASETEDRPRSRQWRKTPYEDVMFSIRQKDAVNKAMSGLQNFNDDEINDMLMDTFEAVTPEIRAKIVDNAPETGYDFGKATVRTFADLAEREDKLTAEEWNAIATLRDNMKDALGIDVLSLNDTLWSMYQTSTFGERDILSAARRAIVADKLGHSPADEARRREIDDELRFSIRREMESMSAADMYNKATSYYMNRLKESFVDMNESVNDLVTAIEKATGMKAEAFEDIRLALNQQSSKGLAAMSKYTSDYLEPLWAQIDTVMKATGMSYDDVVRYVMLKHAVERNDVFAKRDAKSFYRAEFDKVVDPLMADRKKLEKDRKKALADGDITTADECDGKIQAIDVQVAAEQKKLDRHNVMVDNGTAAKYKEFREQDYGGLTSMYSEYPGLLPRDRYKTDEEYNQAARKVRKPIYQTVAEMEVAALGEVDAFERRASGDEFDKLWEKINAATKATLESQYKSNVISKDQYMAVRDEFKYYVPLRGFKDTTAEDIWSYYNTSHSGDFSPALLGAKGRRTEAENPFNWIGTMASSAIAQNMKNESKLALYYFIANRPDQDLMSIKDVWYQFDPTATAEYQQKNPGSRKRVFREVHPPFNESLNADSAKNAYDLWEENMRQQAKNGLAFRGSNSLKVGDDVVFIGAGEAAQHIINLKLRGKEVSLILNANPRAAQAINGLLNIETEGGYQKIFGPVLRWMSAVNTSYNPEFWISNMQRDILFALMGTSIKGGSTSKFLGNLVNPKKIMRMMKAYEEGTLGNSEVENYYREFAESGAITGFTVVSGNEVWEKKIAEFLDPSIWDKIQNSGFMMFWQNLGEAVEQMTRFSAYMSARKSGKDIVEATNAAKEISVNFNRKGSGKHISVEELDKLTRKDGSRLNKTQKAGVYLMSLIPAYGRRAVMFFNAAIQGLNAMYKLWKKNPKRFVGWMTGYFALGVIQAVLHALFDDDDDYLDMPDYTRRNNLLIGYDGIYLKWAMPQEARAFYAFGDMAVNHIMGREPNKNLALEMGNAIADMLPLSATDGVTGLLPSAAQPLVELYTNKDFTGARIYNDMRYLSEDERSKTPKYANALPQTGKIFVNVTEFLNYITGGSEWDAGYINVHPEAIQHVVEGAGGGLLTTINKAWETVGGAIDAAAGLDVTGEKLSVRRFPFLNRLLEVNDERSRNSHVSELFYYYKSEAEHTRTKMSKMKKAGDSDGLSELVESREYEIYTIYKSYEKLMKRYDEQIKIEEDMDEKKALMREQDEYRKEMIYEISKLE